MLYLEVFFERCNGVLRLTQFLQASRESFDCVVLVFAFRGEEHIVQLEQFKEGLGGGVHVPVERKTSAKRTPCSVSRVSIPSRVRRELKTNVVEVSAGVIPITSALVAPDALLGT